MQDARAAALQRLASDAVLPHGQALAAGAVGLVDPADLFVARLLERVAPLPPQQLHDQPV